MWTPRTVALVLLGPGDGKNTPPCPPLISGWPRPQSLFQTSLSPSHLWRFLAQCPSRSCPAPLRGVVPPPELRHFSSFLLYLTVQTCDRPGVQQDQCPMSVQPSSFKHISWAPLSPYFLFWVQRCQISYRSPQRLLQRHLHLLKEVKLVVFQQGVRKRSESAQVLWGETQGLGSCSCDI